jgi:hypothetical protein
LWLKKGKTTKNTKYTKEKKGLLNFVPPHSDAGRALGGEKDLNHREHKDV